MLMLLIEPTKLGSLHIVVTPYNNHGIIQGQVTVPKVISLL